ncbi:MAG: hypothetical protein HY830_26060 [Actinobacteria bacterium]|nr:hypothetical protein [Actinomycetota bacterium]
MVTHTCVVQGWIGDNVAVELDDGGYHYERFFPLSAVARLEDVPEGKPPDGVVQRAGPGDDTETPG